MGNGVAPVDALVVVDMQVAFLCGPAAVGQVTTVIDQVDQLLSAARRAGALVAHLRNEGPPGAVDERGKPGWELHRTPRDEEAVVAKSEDDGFDGTELADVLRGCRRLAVCGVLSEMCVAATAREALARGFGVVLPHRAHATYDVPPGPGGSSVVPAALASRAAEWALGDRVEIVADAAAVTFAGGTAVSSPGPGGCGTSPAR